mgnify:CR=1 FL=1
MSMYTLNAEEFNATYNALNKATNQNIIAAMQELAGILKAHEGESDVIDQIAIHWLITTIRDSAKA